MRSRSVVAGAFLSSLSLAACAGPTPHTDPSKDLLQVIHESQSAASRRASLEEIRGSEIKTYAELMATLTSIGLNADDVATVCAQRDRLSAFIGLEAPTTLGSKAPPTFNLKQLLHAASPEIYAKMNACLAKAVREAVSEQVK